LPAIFFLAMLMALVPGLADAVNPPTGTWITTRSFTNYARTYHTATLLPNGKVLVAGGLTLSVSLLYLNTAELYDPATDSWTPTGSLHEVRGGHTATLLTNGKILVAGGFSQSDHATGPMNRAELYDPATGTWTLTGAMSADRWLHTATLLPNGKVLVVGGLNQSLGTNNSAELYDPVTGAWTATGSLATARRGHTATLLPNGKVLVTGGAGPDPLAGC
jgi:N-acetylneuraminic acid mutarotase